MNLSLSMNCSNTAVGQPGGYSFDSLVVIDGKLYASSADGIFLMEGDTFAGTKIDAFFRTFSTNLGVNYKKQIRRVYVTGNIVGDLNVTLVLDNDESRQHLLIPELTMYFRGYKVSIDRDERGFYVGVKIANVDGVDFAINDISLIWLVLSQR